MVDEKRLDELYVSEGDECLYIRVKENEGEELIRLARLGLKFKDSWAEEAFRLLELGEWAERVGIKALEFYETATAHSSCRSERCEDNGTKAREALAALPKGEK